MARSLQEIQNDINAALAASGGEWTPELNALVAERGSTGGVEEIIEETGPTKEERIQQAAQEYKDNYTNRSLADVEFRADIDPIISGIPPALLKYQDIERKTGGDVGELIKVILGENDPNNPGLFRDFTREDLGRGGSFRGGRYNPTEDERYYYEDNLGEPGVAYAFEPDTDARNTDRLIETLAEELGHGGMRILENAGYDPIFAEQYGFTEEDDRLLEEELMNQYQYRSREDTPKVSRDDIGWRSNLAPVKGNVRMLTNMLNRIDRQALEELRKRGRASIPFTKRKAPEESFLDRLKRIILGGEKPSDPLPRYAQGGIASIRKVA